MSVARGNGKSTVVAGISAAVVDPRAAPRGLLLRSVVRAATGHLQEDRYELQPGAFTPYQVALHIAPQSEFAAGAIVKQVRELGYRGPIYGETVTVGTTALEIAGDAATGLKAITAAPDPDNEKAQEVLANFRERYNYITLPWHLGSAYDDVYIAAECLKQTNDDQDADGFRDCLYEITWSGAIGYNYSFDRNGEVVGLARAVVEVLPPAERTTENYGYRVLSGSGMK